QAISVQRRAILTLRVGVCTESCLRLCFFFSSRRPHTRSDRDWSSDVCSSDLAECVGDGRWFVDKATRYASERVVFGRPIGANQGVQFPIAQAYAAIEAANLMRYKAAWLFEQGQPCGAEANLAKLLGSEASWQAANACL